MALVSNFLVLAAEDRDAQMAKKSPPRQFPADMQKLSNRNHAVLEIPATPVDYATESVVALPK